MLTWRREGGEKDINTSRLPVWQNLHRATFSEKKIEFRNDPPPPRMSESKGFDQIYQKNVI